MRSKFPCCVWSKRSRQYFCMQVQISETFYLIHFLVRYRPTPNLKEKKLTAPVGRSLAILDEDPMASTDKSKSFGISRPRHLRIDTYRFLRTLALTKQKPARVNAD